MSTDYSSMDKTEPDLPLYWDPRYGAYFYRGVMPSPTGEEALQAMYAAPGVEMLPTDQPDVEPIFVPPDEQGFRSRPSSGNRITWLQRQQPPKDTEEWDIPCSVPVLLVVAVLLGAITLLIIFVLWESLRELRGARESTSEEESDELDLQLLPFKVPEGTGAHVGNATLLSPPAVTPGLQAFDDVEYAPPYYLPPTVWSVCLASASAGSSHAGDRDDEIGSPSSPAPCCETVVVCCSVVNHDLTVQALPFMMGSQKAEALLRRSTQCHGKSAGKKIMGVRDTEAVFSKLADAKGHSVFLPSVLRSLTMFGFNGIALLLRDAPEHSNKSVVSLIRALSEALRQRRYTLTLLLLYKAGHHGAYGEELSALNGVLLAPYSLLLYHEVKMPGNTTLWPSPSAINFRTHKEDVINGISVCHLFFKRPILVAVSEACNPSKIQAVAELKGRRSNDVALACSLWSQSWKTRAYRYNTYTCSGRTGILYQTRQQARAFYQDLLARVQSLCFGVIDWQSRDFPSVCHGNKIQLMRGRASFASKE